MGDFKSDLLGAVNNRGKDDVADAIGMPDQQDYETLLSIIQKFEARHPGLIKAALYAGRRDYESGVHRRKQIFTGKATISKDNNMVYVFELPAQLYLAIERVFPSMFRSRKHFASFKKNFYKLTIGENPKWWRLQQS